MQDTTCFESINWNNWIPEERATLLFVIKNGMILLIHKKKGLGAGKINGPGGRIEQGETAMEAAVREVQEELLITPLNVRPCGELCFQFVNGYSLQGYVFAADDFTGSPQETDEAAPLWQSLDSIPYNRMWADDKIWIPIMLRGEFFAGRFLFDEDTMLGYSVTCRP